MMFRSIPSLPVEEFEGFVLETTPVKITNGTVSNQIVDTVQRARGDYAQADEDGDNANDKLYDDDDDDDEEFGNEVDEDLAEVLTKSQREHLERILTIFATRQNFYNGVLRPDDDLYPAHEMFRASGCPQIPVIGDSDDETQPIIGMIDYRELMLAYNRELSRRREN